MQKKTKSRKSSKVEAKKVKKTKIIKTQKAKASPVKKAKVTKPAAKKKVIKKAVVAKKTPVTKKPAVSKKTPVAKKPTLEKEKQGFTKEEYAEIKSMLTQRKEEIVQNVEDKKNKDIETDNSGDTIDLATRSLDKEILFELSDNERRLVGEIEAALRKIEKGTYGVCEHCKKPIEKKRLKFIPAARYCMACQNGTELSRRKAAQ